jgi:imidazole glycerol phosphate synthase subunit HisF
MVNFVFMLTRDDVTVPNAVEVFKQTRDKGVTYVGFKDIGLSMKEMYTLVNLIKKEEKKVFFEVVTENREDALQSVRNAVNLNVDYLIGGTYVEQTLQLLKGKIGFMPYIGEVVGHPCVLRGKIEEIVGDAKRVERLGVSGINLLAYRYHGNAENLLESVKKAVDIPIIVAGGIDCFQRIKKIKDLDMWGFTVGSAIFENKFVSKGDLREQITAVVEEAKN